MYSATNSQGMTARWITRGATLTHLMVPDRRGQLADVVLGFDDVAGYESDRNQYFGCTTGRFANRIAQGRFTLDGVEHQLAVNNGPNHLHGGIARSLDKVEWEVQQLTEQHGVRFYYVSPDGEESYPGTLSITVTYILTDENELRIEYAALTDKPTIINLTNHTYFNLSGQGGASIHDHEMLLAADRYTAFDEHHVPTGEICAVDGTPLDFRTRHRIGERIEAVGGYDQNYVLNGPSGILRQIAEVYDPDSGRILRVHTDQPGVQFYTGNGLCGQPGKGGAQYACQSAFCLETQNFPDAPNHPHFPSAVLRPGETYRHICVYAFGVA